MNINNKPQELDAEELLTKVADLYKIEGEVSPEIATAIDILRQLINEEFVPRGKMVSSQLIYDILSPAILKAHHKEVEAASAKGADSLARHLDDQRFMDGGVEMALDEYLAALQSSKDTK